jgi:lipopolysaccharide export LptBFGC system permease protein LptF
VSRDNVVWLLVAFFGASVVFGGLRRLTVDESTGVIVGVQLVALAVIVGAIFLVYRRRRRG